MKVVFDGGFLVAVAFGGFKGGTKRPTSGTGNESMVR